MKIYCCVCKNYTGNSNSRVVKNKQRLMSKSNCSVCGNKKNMFTSKGSGLLNSLGLNTSRKRMKKTRYGMLLDNYLVTPTDPLGIICLSTPTDPLGII